MWMIRSRSKKDNKGRSQYWSQSVGWTWRDFADLYSTEAKDRMVLPKGGVWEEIE